jgi:hypothetical protein
VVSQTCLLKTLSPRRRSSVWRYNHVSLFTVQLQRSSIFITEYSETVLVEPEKSITLICVHPLRRSRYMLIRKLKFKEASFLYHYVDLPTSLHLTSVFDGDIFFIWQPKYWIFVFPSSACEKYLLNELSYSEVNFQFFTFLSATTFGTFNPQGPHLQKVVSSTSLFENSTNMKEFLWECNWR